MTPKPQGPELEDHIISSLDVAIDALNITKEILSITPAKAVCGSVGVVLTMIRDSMANDMDYVDLGLACADVCTAVGRRMNGKTLDDLSQSVCDAIAQLTTTVAEIQKKVIKRSGRNVVSRLFHAKNDKEVITAWKSDLNRILHVFNTELSVNTHIVVSTIHHNVMGTHDTVTNTYAIVSDIHRTIMASHGGIDSKHSSTHTSIPGESPPPPPRDCFGRDELTEKIIDLAEELIPIALIGPGGIGKTSVSLTVLHHDRIKKRFGDNRRFIRCDQFTASHTHFLNRLSKVIGAGVENPEDLTPLRPFLSSKEMILILDNAESILDPQGMNAEEIYSIVEELSQISNISLCITSRISTIPPTCKTLDIPVLSMEAACDTFYSIYQGGRQSNSVNSILEQLDFHPLSITLLATVAHHSKWNINRLAKEWEGQRIDMLHTQHNKSLATTIELSLASPMFQELGPDARELLGVIAFFPQGVNEDQLEWLFPTLSNRAKLFDNFCILSLTYQSNGFVTMLAPLRDYLYPKDPASSPLLCTTKNQYFSRLSVDVDPGQPGFEEAQWIISEDVNVEHLLDVFTSIDANSEETWNACIHFMRHLYWYKKRLVVLVPRIEGLSDEHNSKPKCLFWLSRLFDSVGNTLECKRLLIHALKLGREQEDPYQISGTLRLLGRTDRVLGLYKEGIAWVEESLEIYKGLDSTDGQAHSLQQLAWLLYYDKQLDAAAEATSQAINLSDAVYGQQFLACEHHRLLGNIYNSKGETEKAIEHFRTTLNILPPNWDDLLFLNHFSLAKLFFKENRPKDADTHIKLAKSHTSNSRLNLGCALELQAGLWYREHRFEEAKSEALHAIGVFENVGATKDVERCRATLQNIDVAIDPLAVSKKSDPNT